MKYDLLRVVRVLAPVALRAYLIVGEHKNVCPQPAPPVSLVLGKFESPNTRSCEVIEHQTRVVMFEAGGTSGHETRTRKDARETPTTFMLLCFDLQRVGM